MCFITIHQLIIICVVSIFWLWWKMLWWIFVYKVLCGHMFLIPLGIYLSRGIAGSHSNVFNILPQPFLFSLPCFTFFYIPSYYTQYNLLFIVFIVYHLSTLVECKLFEGRDLLFCHWASQVLDSINIYWMNICWIKICIFPNL